MPGALWRTKQLQAWQLDHPGVQALYEIHLVPHLERRGLGHLIPTGNVTPRQSPMSRSTAPPQPAMVISQDSAQTPQPDS